MKALAPLNGRPLLAHILDRLMEAGCDEAHLVVGYEQQMIRETIGNAHYSMLVFYVQQPEQLGTGHAVLQAEGRLKEDFLCVNADVIVEPKAYQDVWEKRGFDVVIAAHESREPWKYGCLKVSGDKVLDVVEKPPRGKEPGNLVGLGVYRLTPRIFDVLKKVGKSERGEYEITDAFRLLAKEGKAGFVRYDGLHLDIGSLEGLKLAAEALKKK